MAQKKNKQEEVKAEPVISKLPIPISDSPLVIDLPDGQKLVVGKMIQGTVIEVATWRGTGRPDSRTSRLMLGMSVGDVNPTPEQKAAEAAAQGENPAPTKRSSKLSNPYLALAQEFLWSITSHPIMKKLFGKPEPKQPRAAKKISPENSAVPAQVPAVPAEPISPFTQTAPAAKASKRTRPAARGFSAKLFGKKAPKRPRPSSDHSASPVTSSSSSPSSAADIDAWLDEISTKAKARVEKAEAKKPTPVARKTAKKATTVTKKKK